MKQHKRNMDTNNTNYEVVVKEDGFAYIYLNNQYQGKAKPQYLYEARALAPKGWREVDTSVE
jgi:hypothetical protein